MEAERMKRVASHVRYVTQEAAAIRTRVSHAIGRQVYFTLNHGGDVFTTIFFIGG